VHSWLKCPSFPAAWLMEIRRRPPSGTSIKRRISGLIQRESWEIQFPDPKVSVLCWRNGTAAFPPTQAMRNDGSATRADAAPHVPVRRPGTGWVLPAAQSVDWPLIPAEDCEARRREPARLLSLNGLASVHSAA